MKTQVTRKRVILHKSFSMNYAWKRVGNYWQYFICFKIRTSIAIYIYSKLNIYSKMKSVKLLLALSIYFMRPFVFLILTSSGPFLKCHCFYSRFSKYLNALNYFPGSGFGKRNMLFGHWFPPHEIRSSELGSGCILSVLSNCLFKYFNLFYCFLIVLLSCMNLLYIFYMYILVICNKRATW